jgi:riboflavin kinase/FMN adenylyltransferase
MNIFQSLSEIRNVSTGYVVTMGNFDGVHCGHQAVIAAVRARAQALSAASIAITFDPHPAHVLHPASRLPLIAPLAQKLKLLASSGLDAVLVLPFQEFRNWPARRFVQTVLHETLTAVEVYEGETFRFGHKAEAGLAELIRLGGEFGFAVQACPPLSLRGAPISSSRIRSLIAEGNVSAARSLLGRPFSIRSTPASGRGYGTLYTVPTINLAPYPELLPAHGVYVTTLKVGSGPEARLFHGVTNAGNRPTFGADSYAVETHILDFEPISLDESTPLELTFLHRLRSEQRFPTPEDLRAQIGLDVRRAKRYFALADAWIEPRT